MLTSFARRSPVKASIFILNYNRDPLRVSRCFSSLPDGDDNKHAFAISYMMNNSALAFSQPLAAKLVSRGRLKFQLPEKPDSVLEFFEKQGFSKPQVRKIIAGCPQLLQTGSPKDTLLPKFQFLTSKGLSSSGLAVLVSTNPSMLRTSLVKHIIPLYNFLKTIVGSDADTWSAFSHTGWIRKDYQCRVVQNVAMLQNYGVPQSSINRLMIWYPQTLGVRCDRFSVAVGEMKQMGVDPARLNFVIAVYVKTSISKAIWEKKLNVYRKWGWSDKQILSVFCKHPHCMSYSEEKITAAMDFFVNIMGLESLAILRDPPLLGSSLENRIIPRCLVLNALLSKGLLKKKISMSTFFRFTEDEFLQRYISCYENDAAILLKLFHERMDPATYKQEQKISFDGLRVMFVKYIEHDLNGRTIYI